MAFTDHLLELQSCIGECEQKIESFCFVLLFALRVAQDPQQSESPSILKKLLQVPIADKKQNNPQQTKVLITEECEEDNSQNILQVMVQYLISLTGLMQTGKL